jgi:hypothetical protein
MGNALEILLNDTMTFIQRNPKEFLVLELSHSNNPTGPQIQNLTSMISKYLGQYMWPSSGGYATIKTMVCPQT